jgi:hypothetical protein
MFIGNKVTVGSFVPDDYLAMYCWANDVVAARLDGAFRPVNLKDLVGWCETGSKDPTRIMLSIRQRTDPKIIGYLHIQNINAVHRSADIGIGSARKDIAERDTAKKHWQSAWIIAGNI